MRKSILLRAIFVSLILVVIASTLAIACSTTEPSTTTAPATTAATTIAPTTAPPKTTTVTTTPAAPQGEKYGGTLVTSLNAGLVGNIGYMPEVSNSTGVSLQAVFERLMLLKMDGSIQGELATSWKIADDLKSITINLRKGVKFHDGSDFNAAVCKWNLDLQIAAKKADVASWTSVEVIDDSTIRINLSSYTNTLFSGLSKLTIAGMMSKASFDKNGIEWARSNPVGTGPFMFAEYQRDVKLVLKRNPNYWDPGKPYLDGIVMTVIPDDTVRRLSFEKGDIMAYTSTNPVVSKEMEKSGKFDVVLRNSGPRVLAPASMDPKSPWADVRVRYAASYALDRELMAEALGSGHSVAPYQLMQGLPDVRIAGLTPTKFDPARSKQLLSEAGFPTGFKTTLTGRPVIITKDQVTAVAEMLRNVGIDVTIDTVTSAKYDSMRIGGTWDGILAESMLVQANKNDTFISYFAGLQWQYVKKPVGFQQALNASLATLEIDTNAIKVMIQLLYDDMTVIPFYEEESVGLQNKGYHHDYVQTAFNGVDTPRYADVWLDKSLH